MNLAAEIIARVAEKLQKKYTIPAMLGAIGLIFFVYGLIMLFASDGSKDEVSFQKAEAVSTLSKSDNKIIVDIEGAVVKPGIYHLSTDSRIQDLFIISGGLSAEADRVYVSKNMNLATKLIDGGKVYVPTIDEGITRSASRSTVSSDRIGSGQAIVKGSSTDTMGITETSGLININTASEKELDSLPGVGLVTVSKIIQNRPYQSLDQLVSKKIVSRKVFDNIKSKITY